jgi:hypothetical protein
MMVFFGKFLQISKVAEKLGYSFQRSKSYALILTENGLGNILGNVFTSGHPDCRAKNVKRNWSEKSRAPRAVPKKTRIGNRLDQGCQTFLGPDIPKREKIYQMTTNYVCQTAINYSKWP